MCVAVFVWESADGGPTRHVFSAVVPAFQQELGHTCYTLCLHVGSFCTGLKHGSSALYALYEHVSAYMTPYRPSPLFCLANHSFACKACWEACKMLGTVQQQDGKQRIICLLIPVLHLHWRTDQHTCRGGVVVSRSHFEVSQSRFGINRIFDSVLLCPFHQIFCHHLIACALSDVITAIQCKASCFKCSQ